MTDTPSDAEFWRQRLVAVVQDEKVWQAELNRRSETIAAQAGQLAAGQRSHTALEADRQRLADEIVAMRRVIEDREREIVRLFGEVSKAHRQLQEVWSSFSWSATIPLRSVSARLPGLARGLRGLGERHPDLLGASARTIRNAGRMLLMKPPAPEAPPLPEPEPEAAAPEIAPPVLDLPDSAPRPRSWLLLGDTNERPDESSADLLGALLDSATPLLACVRAPTGTGLASLSPVETAGRLGADIDLNPASPPPDAASPAAGDHVLLASAVWTSSDSDLLGSLTERGIAFSLFIRDISPLLDPAHVDASGGTTFAAWLRTVLTQARCVFVPSTAMCDQILRWAVLSDICVSATVSAVTSSDTVATLIEKTGPATPLEQPGRLFLPGILAPEPLPALELAQAWCTEDDPQVSILVVNRNAYRLTRVCVQQIWASTSGVRYEIVIVDNGSSPDECRALSALGHGVRFMPLGADRFFGEACNIAAEHARAPLLCLLGNDCFGQPGWLESLLGTLETDASAGAAGPLLLSPDMTVREAWGVITEQGFPAPVDRDGEAARQPRSVDYVPAAAMLVRRDAYLRAGGLDLMYEPVSYEDVDLCFKLKALGLSVRTCPTARVIHAAADDDRAAEARRTALDINRSKFVSRWGSFLRDRSDAELAELKDRIFVAAPASPAPDAMRATAALYTPYPITPGGGERFLLTTASELMRTHRVTIVTSHPYSQLRLQTIAHTFGVDLSHCLTQTEAEFSAGPSPDLMVVLSNYVYPPVVPRTPNAVFVCQFPFPMMGHHTPRIDRGYRAVIAYSDYTRAHIVDSMNAHHMPPWPVEVVYPPVPQIAVGGTPKQPIVLTVGRFFTGDHTKRHDLMIAAFRRVLDAVGGEVEMHLVGSSTPGPEHMRYLEELMQAAEGMPISFHVNASRETVEDLYRRAAVYWHATGLGSDLENHPERAEHFGISLVEAMSGECVPLAFDAGGPREIITQGVDGFLYGSVDELVTLTADILRPDAAARRQAIGHAARERARMFAPERFGERMRKILSA